MKSKAAAAEIRSPELNPSHVREVKYQLPSKTRKYPVTPIQSPTLAVAPAESEMPERVQAKATTVDLNNGYYYNDFSDAQDTVWDIGRDETSEFNYKDGKYVMKGLADSLSYSSAVKFNLDIEKDFAISANATHWGRGGSDPFGINFCGDLEQDSYFVFYITSNGYFSIGTLIQDEWKVLVDWTPSANIHPDAGMNMLTVEKQGGLLRFYINDQLEKIMGFPGGYGNYFGLRVDGAQTISFDQFIVKGNQ
jgi:eukaryotic-like serine/threonine-protein kinase